MTYQPPAPPVDSSRKFLNLSGGALLAVIAGVLLVCCIGPIVLCVATPILGTLLPDPPKPAAPTVALTQCAIGSDLTASVSIRITNNAKTSESFTVRVEVRDASGARVGDGSEYVSTLAPGGSASEEMTVFLDSAGGATCHVVGVS